MCGIFAILGAKDTPTSELRKRAVALSQRLRHRGPDWSGYKVDEVSHSVLAHERLAIVDLENGAQPLVNETDTVWLSVNGEIYNHRYLRQDLRKKYKFKTNSDCEPIIYLYEEFGTNFLNRLSGDFVFVLYDVTKKRFMAARDPMGVCPLYVGYGKDGSTWFASEMKSLQDDCESWEVFPPGHFYTSDMPKGQYQRYYDPPYFNPDHIPAGRADHMLTKIREALEASVVKRMMSDVPYGVLLSGGLDSSLVAAIAARHAENRVEEDEKERAWWPRLHSFCIGLKDAPDLKYAKQVADFLGTAHHEFHFTVQVVYHLETYDVTTIRASTPMFLLSRRIKAMGVKMVISGEGSDEIFGGYLYFHRAPNAVEFHKETVRRIKNLHLADCLRANKSTAAWGVEVRVPFLDKDFLDVAMSVDPQEKMCTKERIEKYILRKAFDTPERPFLPHSILWRQKEQFSDGVGYGWIGGLKAHAEKEVGDAQFADAAKRFPDDTPATKEAYFYRTIFEELFPHKSARATVAKWIPTWSSSTDPSGRVQAVHEAALPEVKH